METIEYQGFKIQTDAPRDMIDNLKLILVYSAAKPHKERTQAIEKFCKTIHKYGHTATFEYTKS